MSQSSGQPTVARRAEPLYAYPRRVEGALLRSRKSAARSPFGRRHAWLQMATIGDLDGRNWLSRKGSRSCSSSSNAPTTQISVSTGLSQEDIRRESGEALSIPQMVEALGVAHKIDRERIFVTGLSAGGAMTSVMLAAFPDVFAGGAIIAGLVYGSATTIPEAFDRMRGHGGPSEHELPRLVRAASSHKGPWPTISIWHGTADNTVVPFNADAILVQWQGVHSIDANPKRSETVDGHMRQVWCATCGRELIEEFSIAGMGHGGPLKTSGDNGLGSAGLSCWM